MKVLKVLGIIVLALVAIVFAIGLFLSNEAHLERSVTINASPGKIYQELNTFNNILEWSPWTKIDPAARYEYAGPEYGVGARYSWDSEDPNVGKGSQEIIGTRENKYVKTEMKFVGMEGGSFYAEFILTSEAEGTQVTWTYDGHTEGFFWRYFMAGTDMILGPMYEQGLDDLKIYIEGLPEMDPQPEAVEMDSTIAETE